VRTAAINSEKSVLKVCLYRECGEIAHGMFVQRVWTVWYVCTESVESLVCLYIKRERDKYVCAWRERNHRWARTAAINVKKNARQNVFACVCA
jgi:hypothetical protein